MKTVVSRVFRTAMTASALACMTYGCASNPSIAEVDRFKDVGAVIQSADAASQAGDMAQAKTLLEGAAKANPTSPAPWIKLAQLQFDHGNYPAAITASEEAIQRDATSTEAKGLSLVASLRIAVRNIQDLRGGTTLAGDTRSEAEKLARTLRETIKEQVLVPVAKDEPPKRPARSVSKATSSPAPATTTAPKASSLPATTTTAAPSVSKTQPVSTPKPASDPFGALK